jgi:hypothetical protein
MPHINTINIQINFHGTRCADINDNLKIVCNYKRVKNVKYFIKGSIRYSAMIQIGRAPETVAHLSQVV